MKLEGRVALVTGGGHGIARATALRFAKEGAAVIISEIDRERAATVEGELRALGAKAKAIIVDVNQEPAVDSMVKNIIEEFGKIDILVNVVGGARMYPFDNFHNFTIEQQRVIVDQNLFSSMICTRAVLGHMLQQKYGKIIFTTSISAILGQKRGAAYAAAKAGLEAFAASLGKEVGPMGINVNCLRVGLADTAPPSRDQSRLKTLVSWSHLGRLGRPEEFAGPMLFLASDDSSYMSGSILTVDGGASHFSDF